MPTSRIVTIEPSAVVVQTPLVSEENDTGRPDDAVAETLNAASPYVLSLSGLKVIVCGCVDWIVNDRTELNAPFVARSSFARTRQK